MHRCSFFWSFLTSTFSHIIRFHFVINNIINPYYFCKCERLLFNTKLSDISWRDQGNFQWEDDDVLFVPDQHALFSMFSVLANWNNMSLHSDTLFWFRSNQSLFSLLVAACVSKKRTFLYQTCISFPKMHRYLLFGLFLDSYLFLASPFCFPIANV
jgi:hypothetical protein